MFLFFFVKGATDLRCFMLIYLYFHDSLFLFARVLFFLSNYFYVSLSQNDESAGITFECSRVTCSQFLVRIN